MRGGLKRAFASESPNHTVLHPRKIQKYFKWKLVNSLFPWENQGQSFKPNSAIFLLICTTAPMALTTSAQLRHVR
jgi:hypothetical protein